MGVLALGALTCVGAFDAELVAFAVIFQAMAAPAVASLVVDFR